MLQILHLSNVALFSKISLHTSCFVRLTEFFMGMLLCPIILKLKDKINCKDKKWFIIFTCLEVFSLIGLICAMVFIFHSRAFFVILMCLIVSIFAFDGGIVSKAFSYQPITFLSNIQFEFFILHYATLVVCEAIWFKILNLSNVYVSSAIILFVLIGVCYLYKRFVSKHVEKAFKKALNKLFKILRLKVEI